MTADRAPAAAIERIFREEFGRIVATRAGRVGAPGRAEGAARAAGVVARRIRAGG